MHFSSNEVLYVSKNGSSSVSSLCNLADPCLSVIQACTKGMVYPTLIIEVAVGEYEETQGFSLQGAVNIAGASPNDCFISKPSNSKFALFTLEADNAQLVITKFSIVLTNHSTEYNFFRAVSNHTNIFMYFESCDFCSRSGVVTGQTVYVNNSNANVTLSECSATDVTVSVGPIVCTPIAVSPNKNMKSDGLIRICQLRNCVFTRLTNTLPTARGTAFFMNSVAELIVQQCTFDSCSSAFRGGMGHVYFLGEGEDKHKIADCTLINCSAGEWFSGMYIAASTSANITFTNTSCRQCTQAGKGVFTVFNDIVLVAKKCSFIECRSQSKELGKGGAIFVDSDSDARLSHCAFVSCSAALQGGAIFLQYDGNDEITNCVFIGNRALGEKGKCDGGHDIYISNSRLLLTDSCSDQGGVSVGGTPLDSGDTQLAVCGEDSIQCALYKETSGEADSCSLPCMFVSDNDSSVSTRVSVSSVFSSSFGSASAFSASVSYSVSASASASSLASAAAAATRVSLLFRTGASLLCALPRISGVAICVPQAVKTANSPLLSTPLLVAIIVAGVVVVVVVVVVVGVCVVKWKKTNEKQKIAEKEAVNETNLIGFPAQPSAQPADWEAGCDWDSVDDRITTTEMFDATENGGGTDDNTASDILPDVYGGVKAKDKRLDRGTEADKRVEVYVETFRTGQLMELSTQDFPPSSSPQIAPLALALPLPLPLEPAQDGEGDGDGNGDGDGDGDENGDGNGNGDGDGDGQAPSQTGSDAGSHTGKDSPKGSGTGSDTDTNKGGSKQMDDENANPFNNQNCYQAEAEEVEGEAEAEEVEGEAEAERSSSRRRVDGFDGRKQHKHHSRKKEGKNSKHKSKKNSKSSKRSSKSSQRSSKSSHRKAKSKSKTHSRPKSSHSRSRSSSGRKKSTGSQNKIKRRKSTSRSVDKPTPPFPPTSPKNATSGRKQNKKHKNKKSAKFYITDATQIHLTDANRMNPMYATQMNPMATPQMYPMATPQINPMAAPQINPMAAPQINPMATPQINPMATPKINPMATPQINPMATSKINPMTTPKMYPMRTSKKNVVPTEMEMVTVMIEGEERKRNVPKGGLGMENSNTEWLALLVSDGRKEDKKRLTAEDL